jgi:hypothetical protein
MELEKLKSLEFGLALAKKTEKKLAGPAASPANQGRLHVHIRWLCGHGICLPSPADVYSNAPRLVLPTPFGRLHGRVVAAAVVAVAFRIEPCQGFPFSKGFWPANGRLIGLHEGHCLSLFAL